MTEVHLELFSSCLHLLNAGILVCITASCFNGICSLGVVIRKKENIGWAVITVAGGPEP